MGWSWKSFVNWAGWGSYNAANQTRHRETKAGVVSFPNDEDHAITAYGRENVRLECRNLRRNVTIAAGIGARFADNVVGPGIIPQAKTSDHLWDEEAEAYFKEWAKIADYRQRINFWQMQKMVVQSRLFDGECGFVLVENGQLQPIEAERIRQPQPDIEGVIDGVAVNDSGIRTGYYVHRRDKASGQFTGQDFTLVPFMNFKHCANLWRFDQVRGIPDLAPCVDAIRDLGEYLEATLLKAKNEARQFYTVENEGGAPTGMPTRYETSTVGATLEKVETGEIHYLRKGERLTRIGNETPGAQFDPFVEKCLRLIGAALGLPYEFVLLDFSQGSFSSSRAALLQTYRTFEGWQQWLEACFLQPVWNWVIAKAIKAGALRPAPVDARGVSEWYKVQWQAPEFGWVDPQNETQSHILKIGAGAESLTQWALKEGRDAEEMLAEKGRDIATAMRIAADINKEHGTNITWRDLITLGLPGQVTKAQARDDMATGAIGGKPNED
jgi:lambda family phage portal protein